MIKTIKSKEYFPKACKWLKWCLQNDHVLTIFPTMRKVSFMTKNNTNEQESMVNLVQSTSPKKNWSIAESFEHLIQFCTNWVDYELSSIETGIRTRCIGRKMMDDHHVLHIHILERGEGQDVQRYPRTLHPQRNEHLIWDPMVKYI